MSNERWAHIMREHPEVGPYRDRIQETLSQPEYVKVSMRDASVLLYYRFFEDILDGKYFLTVVKKGLRSFVLTCYITDKVKRGISAWEKS